MYYLYQKLESEIYAMMPKSRRDNVYCRLLDEVPISLDKIKSDRDFFLNVYYSQIISTLSKKDYSSKHINKKKDHPKGHKCGYDHSAARYCWVNFIPAVFNTRGNEVYTIEFRPMQASTSYRKIKNWLLICFALVDIVENHKRSIYDTPNLTLSQVIDICYPGNSEKLISYVDERKAKFTEAGVKEEEVDYQENELDDNFKIISV